jgi:hypothetical protein
MSFIVAWKILVTELHKEPRLYATWFPLPMWSEQSYFVPRSSDPTSSHRTTNQGLQSNLPNDLINTLTSPQYYPATTFCFLAKRATASQKPAQTLNSQHYISQTYHQGLRAQANFKPLPPCVTHPLHLNYFILFCEKERAKGVGIQRLDSESFLDAGGWLLHVFFWLSGGGGSEIQDCACLDGVTIWVHRFMMRPVHPIACSVVEKEFDKDIISLTKGLYLLG